MNAPKSTTSNADETLTEARDKCNGDSDIVGLVVVLLVWRFFCGNAHHYDAHEGTDHRSHLKD